MERFGNSALQTLEFSLQPLELASVIGKFGGSDQLRNAVKAINHLGDEVMKMFPLCETHPTPQFTK